MYTGEQPDLISTPFFNRGFYIYCMEQYINNIKEQVEKCREDGSEPTQINISIQDYQALLDYMSNNQIKMVNQPGFDDSAIESAINTLYLFELPVVQDVDAENGKPKIC